MTCRRPALDFGRARFVRCGAIGAASSLLLLVAGALPAGGGEPPATRRHPDFLRRYAETYRFSLGRPTALTVTPQADQVLFLRSGPRDFVRNLYEADVDTGAERLVLSAEQLLHGAAEELSAEELARRERMRLAARGIAGYQLSRDGRRLLVPLSGKLFVVERASGEVMQLPVEGAPLDPQLSPDARQLAWVQDNDLHVAVVGDADVTRLTEGGSETLSHGLAEFVAQEEMGRMHGYWWSPDGDRLVYQQTDTSQVELLQIGDPAHPERAPQTWRYPRAGATNADVRLGIVPTAGGATVWIDWDRGEFPYLASVRWDEGGPLLILVQNRAQTVADLLEVDPATGSTARLLRETDDAWINLDPSVPRWVSQRDGFLFSSEREGSARLELRARDGKHLRWLHPAEIVYRALLAVDEQGEHAYILASEDPVETHVYRVSLVSDDPPQRITTDAGVHAGSFNKNATAWIDTLAGPDGTIKQMIRRVGRSSGPELKSLAESPGLDLKLAWTTVTDDEIRAIVVRPRDFVSGRRYPVILHVYGGPHSQMVTAAGNRYALDQWLADQGYLVVSFDGRGTPGRTRAWERAIRGNFIRLPLADQVRALEALAKKVPEIDLTRVGVFGWSFGGYFSAMAAISRPDVFQVGVAGAPVTDWRDYDTHYTERYLGLPDENAEGYDASSALVLADQLRRPLLLIHGTADDNVYFLHSLKLSDALFRANRQHEFLPLAGMTHMVTEPAAHEMLYERIIECFDRHLRPGER